MKETGEDGVHILYALPSIHRKFLLTSQNLKTSPYVSNI